MESFVTTVALIGIVIVIASLLSGAIERTGLPLVPIFLLLRAALGPSGLGITNVGFDSPALHALAMLGLALLLFSDAVTIDTKQLRRAGSCCGGSLAPGHLSRPSSRRSLHSCCSTFPVLPPQYSVRR
ncbi:MAG: cation:proton antiporter [Gemmatimonadaceae bacterium]